MTDINHLEAILDRIASGNQTDADLNALRQFIKINAEQNAVQIGKYNIFIGEGRDIRIGDVQGASAEIIQNALRDVLQESVLKIPLPPRPTAPPVVAEFLGRESEFAYFAEKLKTTHLAVIAGIAGVGKTALASVLARQANALEKIFWHTFHEDEGIDAVIWELAGFLAWNGQDELWRMLNSARQSGGQSRPPEMIFNYLVQTVRGHNYLLCFDDLHLVDEDPLLVKLLDQLRGVLLSGELSFIATTRRMPSFVRAIEFEELKGLDIATTRALITKRGLMLSDDLVNDLFRITEGNAQFLMLAMDVLERAKHPARVIANLASTDNVENYLLNQVDKGLIASERAVMSAVALLMGYPGTRDAIEAILEKGNVQRTLSNLKNRFLLSARTGEAGQEYGQHATVQSFYYNLLGTQQRQTMHRRAGKYFETNERDILKASRHYLRAKLPKRAAKLVTDDVWQLINQGQVRALRLVLEMFTDDGLDPILWMKVNLARGQVYAFVGEAKLARDAYQEAYSRSSSIPDSPLANDLRARVCYGMGDLLKNSAPPEALDWLNRGLAESDGISNLERANLLIKIGAVHARMGKFEEALGTLEKGLALLPNQPTQTRAGAYINLGMVYGAQGNPQRAIEFLQQGLEISQRLHDYFQLLIVQGNLGIAKKIFGDWEGASANFQEALALAEKLGSVSEQARMENSLGLLLTLQGRDELAMTHLTRALDLARKHNLKAHLIHTLTSLAELQIRQANWNVAENSHIEAQQLAMSVNAKHQLPEIFTGQAQVELAKGNVQAALELTEKAVNLAHEQRLHVEEGKALRVLGVIMLSNGQRAESANVLQHSLSLLLDRDMYEAARTKLYWAHALISSAEKKQGVELLQDAQKTFARLGAKQDLEIVKNYRSNAESVKRNEC